MDILNLPYSTRVNKAIPKNSFDKYTSGKQKKLFTDNIARITWTHKLSTDTINLEANEIKEIQIFRIELKAKHDIQTLLDVIDKAISYSIIFIVTHSESVYLTTSVKHSHPVNENNAVIDWTFKTEWFDPTANKYSLKLKKSIDDVYHNFCIQLSGKPAFSKKPLIELIEYKKQLEKLEKEIIKIKSDISTNKQFNRKVEMNILLKEKMCTLKELKNVRS